MEWHVDAEAMVSVISAVWLLLPLVLTVSAAAGAAAAAAAGGGAGAAVAAAGNAAVTPVSILTCRSSDQEHRTS